MPWLRSTGGTVQNWWKDSCSSKRLTLSFSPLERVRQQPPNSEPSRNYLYSQDKHKPAVASGELCRSKWTHTRFLFFFFKPSSPHFVLASHNFTHGIKNLQPTTFVPESNSMKWELLRWKEELQTFPYAAEYIVFILSLNCYFLGSFPVWKTLQSLNDGTQYVTHYSQCKEVKSWHHNDEVSKEAEILLFFHQKLNWLP